VNSSFDIATMRAALVNETAAIATALLGEPNRLLSNKRELRFGRKGSLAVVIAGPKSGTWFDHENRIGGDLLCLIRRTIGGGFLNAVEYVERIIGSRPTQSTPQVSVNRRNLVENCSPQNRRRVGALWEEARSIAETIATHYFVARGILHVALDIDMRVLRFHPSCPFDGTRHSMSAGVNARSSHQ
jgi:putative DNA primase/helicase